MSNPTTLELLHATRKAAVAIRNDIAAVQETLREHGLAGFGSLSDSRLQYLSQQVGDADQIVRQLVAVLFLAEQQHANGAEPDSIINTFITKWGK